MIRWGLLILAAATWGAGLVLVLSDDASTDLRIGGVIAAGIGAFLALFAGLAFVRAGERRDALRTSAQAVGETLAAITTPERCCGLADPLCTRYGCPIAPGWTGDRR